MSINNPSSALIDTLEEQHIDDELLPHSRTCLGIARPDGWPPQR